MPVEDFTSFPQLKIRKILAQVAKELYGVDWEPRVVRQRKSISVGTLDFIDYAVPCYELAQKVSLGPRVLAEKLAFGFKRKNEDQFGVESVEGYINFQLTTQLLESMQNQAIAWYENPSILNSELQSIKYHIVGLSLASSASLGTTEKANSYLAQVYELLGVGPSSSYLVDDFSDTTVEPLFGLLEDKYQDDRPKLYREIKRFLGDKTYQNEEIHRAYGNLRQEWLRMRQKETGVPDVSHDLIFESEVSDKVHEYLDNYQANQPIELLKDEASRAVYYIGQNDALSLRSAGGMLYGPAYILYLLDAEITNSKQKNTALVVIGSHRLSLLISGYIKSLVVNLDVTNRVMYFDPRVSKANITEICAKAPSLEGLTKDICHELRSVQADTFNSNTKRHAILNLVDLPLEISELADRLQLPALFDLISQAIDSLEVISA